MGLLSSIRGLASALTSADSTAQPSGTGSPSLLVDGAAAYGGALWTRLRALVRASGAVATPFSELSLDPTTGGLNVNVAGGSGLAATVTQGNGNATVGQPWTVRLSNAAAFIPFPIALGRLADAASFGVALSTEDVAALAAIGTAIGTGNTSLASILAALATSGSLVKPSTPVGATGALAASLVLKSSAGTFRSLLMQIDTTLPGGVYYAMLGTGSTGVPGDGPVTLLRAPQAVVHTQGFSESVNFAEGDSGIAFTVGCWACLSTTQFTKTITGPFVTFSGSVL